MLPFLSKKQPAASGLLIKTRTPDESESESPSNEGKLACARDLIAAMKADDPQGVCDALEAYNEVSGSEAEPHSYDAQNELAGEE